MMQALAVERSAAIANEIATVEDSSLAVGPISLLHVRLRAILFEAEGTASFEFTDPAGKTLPPFTAGAHIDVHLKPGCVRQYSLCNDPAERTRYVVAVQREATGRGGSQAMHDDLRVGGMFSISAPRNFFSVAQGAVRHLLIGGGIGVTPMMAMVAELEARSEPYHLHYCTRSAEKTAFMQRLAPLIVAGRVSLYHDGGVPSQGLDVAALLRDYEIGTHLYYCGPDGFMAAIKSASSHWPKNTVHFEYFSAPAEQVSSVLENQAFRVKLARSGLDLEVPAEKTIVEVLREHDVFIETSCEEGYCGTCLTRCIAGEPEHRDSVLDEDDRKEFILVCCSRSKTPMLTLDL